MYTSLKPLRQGDVLAVVSPAGIPDEPALLRGLDVLRTRYTVRTYRDSQEETWGMYSGTDKTRRWELKKALSDPDVRCVIPSRGGYGTARILDDEIFQLLEADPKLLMGFSDITVLLCAALKRIGIKTIHGPMACQVGRGSKGIELFEKLIPILETSKPSPPINGLKTLVPGKASGPLIGGNLTLLAHLVGTPYFPDLDGAILMIEDVAERPYRIDRCLNHLKMAGVFDGLAGFIVGDLTDCEPKGSEHTSSEVIEQFAKSLGVPSVCGFPVGHGTDNFPVVLGAETVLDAEAGSFQPREGAVDSMREVPTGPNG